VFYNQIETHSDALFSQPSDASFIANKSLSYIILFEKQYVLFRFKCLKMFLEQTFQKVSVFEFYSFDRIVIWDNFTEKSKNKNTTLKTYVWTFGFVPMIVKPVVIIKFK
jgi:hypothetical protein